ncbi:MAG: VWA domain-containing protein, partial [Planctomycetia bacterium]
EREATVELHVLLLDSDPEFIQEDRSAVGFFPTTKTDLFTYDVLILGDVAPSFFTQAQQENIREFVRVKGGGFLVIAGGGFAPRSYRDSTLEELLPVEIGPAARAAESVVNKPFQPRLTVDGRASPIFRFSPDDAANESIWADLPPMFWYAKTSKAKPGAQVLAEHPETAADGQPTPLVATQFYGAGRTYFQAFDGSWRWRKRVGDVYHARYWIQTVRYLSRAKLLGKNRAVEVTTDRRRYRRGDPVQLRVRFLDESVAPVDDDGATLSIEREGRAAQTVALRRLADHRGVFETVFGQTEDGSYRVRLQNPVLENGPTVEFQVTPPPGELDRVQMNEADLKQAADVSKGAYRPLERADELFSLLPAGRKVVLQTDAPVSLWNTWPVLWLFAALLVVEWVVRKRLRMV